MNSFVKSVDVLHRAISAGTVRRSVIANNIANADTPNFKRTTVNFESELKRVLESETRRPALELARTDPAHFANHREQDYRDVQIRRVVDYASVSNNNGNNVDPEQEFMLSLQNQMSLLMLMNSVDFEFSQVSRVLRG
ncbi:MAG: flagellar basal body rod protein FlgB [Treponema sp.]|nr:flagellar basal body rod protein FlgB [Treponema sp.]